MRADGKKLKHVDPMYKIVPHIMTKRYDSMNMITIDIPYEPMQNYINAKRKEGIPMSHMAVLIAAYLRTCAQYPALNRFIMNKKVYARNEYCISMVVLTPGTDGEETESKMYFDPADTVFDVNNKINDFVEANRNAPKDNGLEKFMNAILSVPGLLTVGVSFLKMLDKLGLLPKSIIDISPFHNSLVISNLISIRTNHIYHHVYEFGTTGIIITMGNLREVPKRKGGEIVFEKTMPLGVVMDERICSGYYFARAFRVMQRYLKNPELLETPPAEVVKDPGL
ncbi:MAG: 2-oxo acid dehydrogenase subunit E2 [Clostridia bacterium]|nr:2-oxo acid dehydrogenase subunit E2 [Clostridia bacterium]